MKCRIRDLTINYEIMGEGKPVLMLHGFTPDHRLMTGCMEPVFCNQTGYRRIYLDLPGMGRSEAAPWVTDSDTMLEVVMEFIDQVIPGETFLLAGESYGGYLARGIIYRRPQQVDGVALICPVINADREKRILPEPVVLVEDQQLLSRLTPKEARGFKSIAVVQNPQIYQRYQAEILSGVEIANQEFLARFRDNDSYEFTFNENLLNEQFAKPTLLLLGRQDHWVGYQEAWSILDNYPRATFAVLDRAGHNLQLDQEELFNTLMHEWLRRVNEYHL